MFICPKNNEIKVCRGPAGWYYGCVSDSVIQCRLTDYATLESLVVISAPLKQPECIKCEECKHLKEG